MGTDETARGDVHADEDFVGISSDGEAIGDARARRRGAPPRWKSAARPLHLSCVSSANTHMPKNRRMIQYVFTFSPNGRITTNGAARMNFGLSRTPSQSLTSPPGGR